MWLNTVERKKENNTEKYSLKNATIFKHSSAWHYICYIISKWKFSVFSNGDQWHTETQTVLDLYRSSPNLEKLDFAILLYTNEI